MPTQQIHTVEMLHGKSLQEQVEYLTNEVAKLQKILRYLLNGQLDFENIRAAGIKTDNLEAGSVTADKMNVYGLTVTDGQKETFSVSPTGKITVDGNIHMGEGSSINWDDVNSDPATAQAQQSANMARKVAEDIADGKYDGGTFIDGTTVAAPNIVGGVITGPTIQTAITGRRLVLTGHQFRSYNSSNQQHGATISSDPENGGYINFYKNGSAKGYIMYNQGFLGVEDIIEINSSGRVEMYADMVRLFADLDVQSYDLMVTNWSRIRNMNNNRTLQSELNNKADVDDLDDYIEQGTNNVSHINFTNLGMVIWFKDNTTKTVLYD